MGAVIDTLVVGGRRLELARATETDVPALVALLADDPLGAHRESSELTSYVAAFREIDADANQLLVAVRDEDGEIVGTLQLTLIPGLSRGGAKRLQIEGVRIGSRARGLGLGSALFAWAHEYGRQRGARIAQLTSDKTRADAHRFYERLGYEATHEGFKLAL